MTGCRDQNRFDVPGEVNKARRMARLRGVNQALVQACMSEVCSPARVTGMAGKVGHVPGLAMDLVTIDERGLQR